MPRNFQLEQRQKDISDPDWKFVSWSGSEHANNFGSGLFRIHNSCMQDFYIYWFSHESLEI